MNENDWVQYETERHRIYSFYWFSGAGNLLIRTENKEVNFLLNVS